MAPTDDTALKYRWLDAVCSADGPESPTMRHCLMALARYMEPDGTRCYPSTDRLAQDTGRSLRTVQDALRQAEEAGWIARESCGGGQGWRRYQYHPAIPKRAAAIAAPSPKRAAIDDVTCGNPRRNVRQPLPLTSPVTSPETTPVAQPGGWPARAACVWREHVGAMSPGRIGKALSPLVAEHGEAEVEEVLARYLIQERAKYVSLKAFAEKYLKWRDDSSRPSGPPGFDPSDTWEAP